MGTGAVEVWGGCDPATIIPVYETMVRMVTEMRTLAAGVLTDHPHRDSSQVRRIAAWGVVGRLLVNGAICTIVRAPSESGNA